MKESNKEINEKVLEEKVYEAKLKVKYVGKNKLFLHEQIGEGTLSDGRKCRLIMLNNAILMEVTLGKDEWEHYSVNWMDLSEAISGIIPKQQFGSSYTLKKKVKP